MCWWRFTTRRSWHAPGELGAEIIGVNNRDLRDFSVDVGRTAALIDRMPPGAIVVSESGISSAGQLEELQALGVHAVLVGETLMRAPDPAAALAELRSLGTPLPTFRSPSHPPIILP